MKLVKLTMGERFALMGLAPKEGSYADMKCMNELADKLNPTEDEAKKLNIRQEEGKVSWSDTEYDTEIEIGETALGIIKSALIKKDSDNKLKSTEVTLYQKFVEEKKEESKT
jgi:hypothetical protein